MLPHATTSHVQPYHVVDAGGNTRQINTVCCYRNLACRRGMHNGKFTRETIIAHTTSLFMVLHHLRPQSGKSTRNDRPLFQTVWLLLLRIQHIASIARVPKCTDHRHTYNTNLLTNKWKVPTKKYGELHVRYTTTKNDMAVTHLVVLVHTRWRW